jgi:hypothetical protein
MRRDPSRFRPLPFVYVKTTIGGPLLAVTSYSAEHVQRARDRFAQDVGSLAPDADAINLVLALDRWFVHRMRGAEGKDGNALNQVRALADSVVDHDGVLTIPKAIRLEGVLGLSPGDPVSIDVAGFERLADAFFAELKSRYPPA